MNDLTVEILKQIRDGITSMHGDFNSRFDVLTEHVDGLTERPRLIHWVARTKGIEAAAAACPIPLGPLHSMARGNYRWRITIPDDGSLPGKGIMPTLIEWDVPQHPAESLPSSSLSLVTLAASHPEPAPIRAALSSLGLNDVIQVTYDRDTRLAREHVERAAHPHALRLPLDLIQLARPGRRPGLQAQSTLLRLHTPTTSTPARGGNPIGFFRAYFAPGRFSGSSRPRSVRFLGRSNASDSPQ